MSAVEGRAPGIYSFAGDPNGTLAAPQGALCLDTSTPAVWQNTTGSTVWAQLASGGGGSGTFDVANQIAPVVAAGTTNNFSPTGSGTASAWILGGTPVTQPTLTGILLAGGNVAGRVVMLTNETNWPIIVNSEDAGSTAANRFDLPGNNNTNWTIPIGATLCVRYDGTAARWRLFSSGSWQFPSLEVDGPLVQVGGDVQFDTTGGIADEFDVTSSGIEIEASISALLSATSTLSLSGGTSIEFDSGNGGIMEFISNPDGSTSFEWTDVIWNVDEGGPTALATGNNNDLVLAGGPPVTETVFPLTSSAGATITGIDSSQTLPGPILLFNANAIGGGVTITLSVNDAGSLLANRLTGQAASVVLTPGAGRWLFQTLVGGTTQWTIV